MLCNILEKKNSKNILFSGGDWRYQIEEVRSGEVSFELGSNEVLKCWRFPSCEPHWCTPCIEVYPIR